MKKMWGIIVFLLIAGIGVLSFMVVNKTGQYNDLESATKIEGEALQGEIDGLNDEIAVLMDSSDSLETEKKTLDTKYQESLDIISDKEQSIIDLKAQIEELMTAQETSNGVLMDEASIFKLKDMGIDDYTVIADDLRVHTELIGFEGVVGGTMQFSDIFVMNDQWVYARFEDGHIMGYGLFMYTIEANKDITWGVMDSVLDN